MPNVKISDLPSAANALGTQELEVNDSGVSRKVTGSQMVAMVEGTATAFVKTTTDQSVGGKKTFTEKAVMQGPVGINLPNKADSSGATENGDLWQSGNQLWVRRLASNYLVFDSGTLPPVSQAEAEAGTAVVQRTWSAQRVKQAIDASAETNVKDALNATGDAPIYACRAWVNFNGTTTPPTIRATGNVSSVASIATGVYRVSMITALPDANYSVLCNGVGFSGNPAAEMVYSLLGTTTSGSTSVPSLKTTTQVEAKITYGGSTNTANSTEFNIAIFR